MPTSSSVANSIRKPFISNKRLLGLLMVFFIVIGALVAGYYYHIKNNEKNFRETRLQRLDSSFNLIDRQLNNKIQRLDARRGKDTLTNSIWNDTGTIASSFSLGEREFDHFILIIKDLQHEEKSDKEKPEDKKDETDKTDKVVKPVAVKDKIIYKSSLKGALVPLDTLFQSDLLNIGISMPIPKEEMEYQLFGKEYHYENSINQKVKYKITIVGLVKADRYHESIRALDSWVIALLTTFLLLFLFGLPYFKMLFIAEDERLSNTDVIMSGISVVVGAPIIMVVFLALMYHYYEYYDAVPNRLKALSAEIGNRFEKENNDNVIKLSTMSLKDEDSIYKPKKINQPDALAKKEGTIPTIFKRPEKKINQKRKPDVHQLRDIPYTNGQLVNSFNFITKIDTAGKALYHIALVDDTNIENTKSLASRPYFKDIKKSENLWISSNDFEYVMRPVVSIESQTEEAVYILENKNDNLFGYRVGASQLKSIHEPILPFGYQFAIIDNKGDVWFHSEEGRATLENFYTVSRQFKELSGALMGRIDAGGVVNYRDESKLYNVKPVNGTNLSVVTLYDIGLIRARVSEVLTLASLAIILAFVLMLVITVLSLIIRNPKLGLYKYDRFLFEYLTPRKEHRDIYVFMSTLFFIILLISVIVGSCCVIQPSKVYIVCLLLGIWAYVMVFYTLHPHSDRRAFKFRIRDILLFLVVLFLNTVMFKMNPKSPEFAVAAILLQVFFVGLIALSYLHKKRKDLNTYQDRPIYIVEKTRHICKKISKIMGIGYKNWYAIFLFSWLLLAAVYPAYLMFEKAQDQNELVWFKAEQMYMARKFIDKQKRLPRRFPAFEGFEDSYAALYQNHLQQGLYPEAIDIVSLEDNIVSDAITEVDHFRLALWATRPIYDERAREFQALVYEHSDDGSWCSKEELEALTFDLDNLEKNGGVTVSGHRGSTFMNVESGIPFLKVAGILIILAILFSLILFFVDRFFGFRFRHLKPTDFDEDKKHHYIKKFAEILRDEQSNYGLLIIGLPFSGKLAFARKVMYMAQYSNIATLSMLRLDTTDYQAEAPKILNHLAANANASNKHGLTWEDNDVFVFEHLEHNIKSYEANHAKLKLISFLISEKKRVILISEVYPSQIFALYENPPLHSDLPLGSFEDDFNSWRNILSAFPQVLLGISENKKKVYNLLGIDPRSGPTEKKKTLQPLIDELGHSQFLPTLAPVISRTTLYPDKKKERLDRQRMVMQTQNLSHGYYNDIWNALPTRERYLLYDLAKDGFLNIKNRNALFSLMKKGLIVWKDRPRIFNDSFKNFIITSVSLNEALRLENKNRGKGTWGNARILLYLVILTIIVFIAMGKPELLKDFETLVGALGGLGVIIPLVSRLLASGSLK